MASSLSGAIQKADWKKEKHVPVIELVETRETKHHNGEHKSGRPVRPTQGFEQKVAPLQDAPSDRSVNRGGAQHFAPMQIIDKPGVYLFLIVHRKLAACHGLLLYRK